MKERKNDEIFIKCNKSQDFAVKNENMEKNAAIVSRILQLKIQT